MCINADVISRLQMQEAPAMNGPLFICSPFSTWLSCLIINVNAVFEVTDSVIVDTLVSSSNDDIHVDNSVNNGDHL